MKKASYNTSLNADLAKYREGVCKSKCNFAWLNARCAFSFVNKCECVNAAVFIFLSLGVNTYPQFLFGDVQYLNKTCYIYLQHCLNSVRFLFC